MVPIDLQGRTALVTEASRGIGRAVAVRLAEAGARVVVHYRSDREGAQATVDAIASFGEGHAVSADLNNAGIYPSASIEEMTSAEWAEPIGSLIRLIRHQRVAWGTAETATGESNMPAAGRSSQARAPA